MWLESSNHFDSCESLAGQPRLIITQLVELVQEHIVFSVECRQYCSNRFCIRTLSMMMYLIQHSMKW